MAAFWQDAVCVQSARSRHSVWLTYPSGVQANADAQLEFQRGLLQPGQFRLLHISSVDLMVVCWDCVHSGIATVAMNWASTIDQV